MCNNCESTKGYKFMIFTLWLISIFMVLIYVWMLNSKMGECYNCGDIIKNHTSEQLTECERRQ